MSEFHADRGFPSLDGRGPTPPARPARPRRRRPLHPRPLPRYRLVLHGDAADLMAVVRAVMDIVRCPREEAMHRMWTAHHRGTAEVLTTYLERAEFLAERFAERGLRTTLAGV